MSIVNIAAYRFVNIDAPQSLRDTLLSRCTALSLKGTILVSAEGINLFLAGTRTAIDQFLASLRDDGRFAEIAVKESASSTLPFRRLLVKLKREIIAGGTVLAPSGASTSITPGAAPRLAPAQLKQWLDEGKPLTLLDTRNEFEIEFGTFRGAQHLGLKNFREFAEKSLHVTESADARPIVTFCTGGIRCEKAAPMLIAQGVKNVYQLDGGILAYFEQCGGTHYRGECFVFDERVALDTQLRPFNERTQASSS